jgi:hypothetical protein
MSEGEEKEEHEKEEALQFCLGNIDKIYNYTLCKNCRVGRRYSRCYMTQRFVTILCGHTLQKYIPHFL